MFSQSSTEATSIGIGISLRLPNLESEIFTEMVIQLAGYDDEALYIETIVDKCDDIGVNEERKDFKRYVDGNEFTLCAFREMNDHGIAEEYVLMVMRNRGRTNQAQFFREEDDDDYGTTRHHWVRLVDQAFRCMKADKGCSVCTDLLKDEDETFCNLCLMAWNTKGCKICQKRVGFLKAGIHSECLRKKE